MEIENKIKRCWESCWFYGITMDGMQCNHPYWKDKGSYDNMIITHENSRNGNIPEKCPLRQEELVVTYKL